MVLRRLATFSAVGPSTAAACSASASCAAARPSVQTRGQAAHQQAPKKDFYQVLGVTRGAKDSEIKKAYLQKAKKLHPDVNPSPKAAEEFSEVKKAYETLSDPQKKSMYDMTGNASDGPGGFPGGGPGGFNPFANAGAGGQNPFANMGGQGGQNPFAGMGGQGGNQGMNFSDFEEMFAKMSGAKGQEKAKKPQGPEPGADVHFKLRLSFLEAVNGASKEISYNTLRKSPASAKYKLCSETGTKEAEKDLLREDPGREL